MATSPVVEWRAATSPFSVLASIALTGTGVGGAIPLGTNSFPVTVRVYNNFGQLSGVADAQNCVLAVYDDAVHQGQSTTSAVTGTYLQVQVLDYDGTTTGADLAYYPIGGTTKHPVPVNGGTLQGAGAGTNTHYVEVSVQITAPATAFAGQVSQGLWLEYSSTS